VSVPVVLAAFVLRRPVILHESDGSMGLSNRISSRFAKVVCVAFPDVAKGHKNVVLTGNPIRKEILNGNSEKGYSLTGFTRAKPVLLVWGGSQGAQEINDLIVDNFSELMRHFQIIHVSGKGKATNLENSNYIQFEYLAEELAHVYAITDMVFGRAGANSLYELAAVKKPNVVLPLTQNKDQMKNAEYFEQRGGTIILRGKSNFLNVLTALAENEGMRQDMKNSLAEISKMDAAEKIAQLILNSKF